MKFSIGVQAFADVIKQVAGFAAPSSEAKEIQCVKIETDEDRVIVSAQNRDSWVDTWVNGVMIEHEGSTLIPAVDLRRWLSACPTSNPLEVELVGDQVRLSTGRSKCEMSVLDPLKFPAVGGHEVKNAVTLPGGEFVRALSSVMFATDKKETAIIKTDVVMLDIGEKDMGFMATDSKAISVVVLPLPPGATPIVELVPAANLHLLLPMIEGGGDVQINLSKFSCVIETERMKFGTKLVVSKGMPWRKIMKAWDHDRPEKTWLPAKDMLAAVRQVAAADPTDLRMTVQFGVGMVMLSNKKSEAVVEIPACMTDMRFAVDYEYLVDFFSSVVRQSLNVTIEWGIKTERDMSVILRAGTDWRYMLVPLIDEGK